MLTPDEAEVMGVEIHQRSDADRTFVRDIHPCEYSLIQIGQCLMHPYHNRVRVIGPAHLRNDGVWYISVHMPVEGAQGDGLVVSALMQLKELTVEVKDAPNQR